jgi:DNA-binding transcriptional MerR regulator
LEKSPEAFRTISEVATDLDVPQHVLRFWESKFSQIRPMKRGGGRRYYRPQDVDLLRGIRHLLYGEGYTIRGVQKILRENGIAHVIECATEEGRARMIAGAEPGRSSGPVGSVAEADIRPVKVDQAMLDAAADAAGLTREQVQVLQATLYELSEIKRIVDESGD